jgi:nucleotide-binding universal stress UspA family protein
MQSNSEDEARCAELTIRHVLVLLDGSQLAECALPWAVAVAQVFAARITLLRVLETPAVSSSTSHHHDAVDWEMRRAEAQSRLAAIDRGLKARRMTSTIELLEGRPAEQIINFAGAHQVDLVALSSHGEGGLSGWALSSTAAMVVARARTSVLVVPAHAAGGPRIGDRAPGLLAARGVRPAARHGARARARRRDDPRARRAGARDASPSATLGRGCRGSVAPHGAEPTRRRALPRRVAGPARAEAPRRNAHRGVVAESASHPRDGRRGGRRSRHGLRAWTDR